MRGVLISGRAVRAKAHASDGAGVHDLFDAEFQSRLQEAARSADIDIENKVFIFVSETVISRGVVYSIASFDRGPERVHVKEVSMGNFQAETFDIAHVGLGPGKNTYVPSVIQQFADYGGA